VQWCAVWDSDKKDFMGIIILRDLLEMLVFFVEALKETFARDELSGERTKDKVSEAEFVASFIETYLGVIIDHNHIRSRSISFRKRSDSGPRHIDVDAL
jgi:hypothetical protein